MMREIAPTIKEFVNHLDSAYNQDSEHRLNENVRMNPPEDRLKNDLEIWVYGEIKENNIKEPHFHVYMKKDVENRHFKIDIEIKIKNIDDLIIWHSKSGHTTWDGLGKLYKILKKWINFQAYDTTITNKEAIRQEWNRCNMSNRVKQEEL